MSAYDDAVAYLDAEVHPRCDYDLYSGMRDIVDEMEVENARLRDLVKDVQRFHECGRDCTECPLFNQCHEGNLTNGCIGSAIIHDRMYKLGIEVDA